MAALPDITQSELVSWGGAEVFNQALHQVRKGAVLSSDWIPAEETVRARIALPGGGETATAFRLRRGGGIISKCPCETNRRFSMVCWHVVAAGIMMMLRRTDPVQNEKCEAERRAAKRMADIDPALYIKRGKGGTPCKVSVSFPRDFAEAFWREGKVRASVLLREASGRARRPEEIGRSETLSLSQEDEDLLSVLEDINGGPIPGAFDIPAADFMDLAALLTREKPVETRVKCEMDAEDGSYRVFAEAEIGGVAMRSPECRFLAHGREGFAFAGGRFHPMRGVLPAPFHSLYSGEERVEREAVPQFMKTNLPALAACTAVECDPPADMLVSAPAEPVFRVALRGSRASLSAELFAKYGAAALPACENARAEDVCLPDPDDLLLYRTRNLAAEAAARAALESFGFERDAEARGSARFTMADPRAVLGFLGTGYPALHRRGWKFELSARLTAVLDAMPLVVPVVSVRDAPGGAFEVKIAFDAAGRQIPETEIQRAVNKGDAFIHTASGETVLLDVEAVKSIRGVFADCRPAAAGGGRFRIPGVFAPYVRSSLLAFDGFDIDESRAPDWREAAARRNRDEDARCEPVPLGPLEDTLRPYQKQGVYWMRFLEKSGMCGLLADEMGLGKTLQTLAWLSLERTAEAARGKPALVVCPTSLVENWAREAEKFTPWVKTLVVSGPDRAALFPEMEKAGLVVTSYALLQRDIEEGYAGKTFSAVVLDEAQHIKNRRTRNARAAKALDAVQKLVLTGTPVENSVADVWSIFDFLMPDYLGDYEAFRANTEAPIAEGGDEGRAAQEKLRRKLHPFILRRVKKDVARDLPDKITDVRYCAMTPYQQRVYNSVLGDTRRKVGDMVKQKGFRKSRFEILALLMRLRQISCHPAMLKECAEGKFGAPPGDEASGKLEAFLELLDEAMDAGHRVLVFSQFVKMLSILRGALEERSIPYCYLDGSTKNRLEECRRFNFDASIPVFLISLHAGGTGLNLTGADTVVHFDPWWNPAVEDQATDRAHRIGQKKTVHVAKLIASGSVEERVLALQRKKRLVIDATVGATDAAIFEKMDYSDIAEILGMK